ncbi:MAG: redoxin domain-containing protein [Paludibacter sp.]
MKKINIILVILLSMTFAANANVPEKLNLSGTVKNVSSGTIYLQRYENKSFFTIDSTLIINGKFKFSNTIKLPEIYGLAIDNTGNPFHSFLIFLDKNLISVELDTINEFENTVVTGSVEQDLFKQFSGKQKSPISQIIKENPTSLAALYLFYRYYSYRLSSDEIRKNIQLFDPKFKNTAYIKVLSELANNLEKVSVGSKAPDFKAQKRDGNIVKLSDFLGKGYVLVDFWASWCIPCRKESPDLVKLNEKFKDKGLEIIGVSLDNNKKAWLGALEKDKLPWTQLIDLEAWAGNAVKTYGVRLIPYKFLIDKNGIIVAKNLRGEDLDKLVGTFIDK